MTFAVTLNSETLDSENLDVAAVPGPLSDDVA